MKKNEIPTSGLAISTSYRADKSEGEFLIRDISNGDVLIHERFSNIKTSDNVLGLIGICRACQYSVEQDFIGKVYTRNMASFNWAINKRYKTKVSSAKITKLLEDNMPTLSLHDFEDVIALWNPNWGNMSYVLNSIALNSI